MGLGFKKAGFEIVGAWDKDEYAVKSYSHNIGKYVKQVDIRDMNGEDVPYADIWLFGFPCVSISRIGKKEGIKEGTDSGLLFEITRLLGEVDEKPKIILAENVKKLALHMDIVKEEYKKAGYKMLTPQLCNSLYWNVPQNRERYFVIGVREDLDLDFKFPIQAPFQQVFIENILEDNVKDKYYMSFKPKKVEREKYIIEKVLEDYKVEKPIILHNIYGGFKEKKPRVYMQYSPTIRTAKGGGHLPFVLEVNPYRVRSITPRECARLQGFPEDFEIVVSDKQAFNQFGNAVTVNVSFEIAKAIKSLFENKEKNKNE